VSNPDSFIAEVTEEVRRDRLFALFRRYGWIAGLLVVLVVGGAAWNEWRKARDRAEAEAFGSALLDALALDDRAARATALAELPAASGGRAAILGLIGAAEALAAGDREAALAGLERVAGDASVPESYRQLAALKRVMLAGPALPAAEREQALAPLLAAGGAFRPMALEQVALLRIEAGETAAAATILNDLLNEPDVTDTMRRRVQQVLLALGAAPRAG
jgi:hypothetical protein